MRHDYCRSVKFLVNLKTHIGATVIFIDREHNTHDIFTKCLHECSDIFTRATVYLLFREKGKRMKFFHCSNRVLSFINTCVDNLLR